MLPQSQCRTRSLYDVRPLPSEPGREEHIPGCTAKLRISSTVSISLSGGACNTMTTEPIKHVAQPSLPNVPSFSFRKYDPSTDLLLISHCPLLSAPLNIPYQHTQCSQRRDQNRRCECICCKICYLANDHYNRILMDVSSHCLLVVPTCYNATPPCRIP